MSALRRLGSASGSAAPGGKDAPATLEEQRGFVRKRKRPTAAGGDARARPL